MTTITARSMKNYQVEISNGHHVFFADEPASAGGGDTAPNPYDILLGALAACKIITVQMYAKRKEWPLESVVLEMKNSRVHAEDCDDCEGDPNAKVDIVEVAIEFKGDLSPQQIDRLKDISEKCPVHRTLTSETKIRTTLHNTAVLSE